MKVCINPNWMNLINISRFFNFQSRSNNPIIKSLKFQSAPRIRTLDLFLYSTRTMAISSSTASSVHYVNEEIFLTEEEDRIFQRLRDVVGHFKLQTQLRVAGGWVRDKLLGKKCYDIDFALDNMLGTEFCEKVNEYFSHIGEETQRVGVIQSNPDQSKHLETATMRIFDISMDFVNLRATVRIAEFLQCRRAMAISSSTSSSVHYVNEEIFLTEEEDRIFQRLRDVVGHFKLQTQLRVAGGWVRDKLLGKKCYDIDIALDNMLGTEFCEKVNEYFSHIGEETQRVGVIQSNPDQSKHLKTATMRIFDISMDFVNLRATRFGTAKEDAYRRDLTINILFYNINTRSIEDFTQRGLDDLKKGRIVTPLPAKDTFLDDPLRVLRAIRFGARFGFELDEELKEAASCKDVRDAINNKISRERIGHEIDLMISGTRPVKAMTYIHELHLFWDVFSLPLECEPSTKEEFDRVCISYIDAVWGLIDSMECCSFTDEEKRLSSYAALFLPLRKTIHRDKKAKEIPVTDYIFRNSLKLKVNDAQAVINLHNASEKFVSLIPPIVAGSIEVAEMFWVKEIIDVPAISKLRLFTGLLLDEIKSLWRVALLLSTLLYPTSIDCTSDSPDTHSKLEKRLKLFISIEEKILKMGLDKIWEIKPLVNGKDIMHGLQLTSGGPLVREWQLKLRQWQLANPDGTAEDCLNQIQSKRSRME